jgi:hypothetical protein
MIVFGLIGLIALIPDSRWPLAVVVVGLVIRAVWWHAHKPRRFWMDRQLIQARRGRAGSGWTGNAYFGWILGTTLFTEMTTPVVQALPAAVGVLGLPFSAAAGIGLGLARSYEPWRGALGSDRGSPHIVVQHYVNARYRPGFRFAGIAVVALILSITLAFVL